jgi:neural Wiskott-Aldrich syndrome protein
MPHPEGQPGQEGSPPHNNGQPPMMPYYIHPGGYAAFPPPYPLYPPQGALPPTPVSQAQSQPAQTSDSADAAKKAATTVNGSEVNGATVPVEAPKKPRTSKSGESKAKKAKTVNPRDVNGTKVGKGSTGNEGTNPI